MPKELDKSDVAVEEGQYVLRPQDKEELKRNDTSIDDVPSYRIRIKLTDEQKERLTKQFQEEFRALLTERQNLGLPAKWAALDRQYDGIMKKNAKLSFNLHTHQTKIKTDAIVRALNEAFLDSQPMVDVSPRPEFWKEQDKSGDDVCEKQQQFIQYEMEENIKPSADITRVGLCAVKKFVGIMKLEWCYEKELRKREETYAGENETVGVENGQPVIENKALKEFEGNYPNWQQRGYQSYHDKIAKGGTVNLVVEYLDTIQNSAKWRHVSIEDFYVRNSTFYNDGLKKAHLVVERDTMTYWELLKKEKNEEFDNIDDICQMYPSASMSEGGTKLDYKNNDYPVLEATMYGKLEETDEEETKMKLWFAEIDSEQEKQTDGQRYELFGAILYPYYGFDIDYKAFYVKLNNDGFYGGAKSVVSDLKDSNIAQDAILSLSLHSMYIRNILTPICKEGSEIENMFIENRWQDGRPLTVDAMTEKVEDAMAFVQYPQINLQDFIVLGQQMQKIDSGVTGITDAAATGRADSSDPHAPASKTIALLNQSGINIKDYIRTFLPAFNEMVGDTLQLYYQMSQEGKKYKVSYRSRKVTGRDAFASITRDEMIARTNIQARASAFAFDKIKQAQENMAGLQMIATSPVGATQPEAYYKALVLAVGSISPMWKNFTETDMLSPAEFAQKQQQVAMQAVAKILELKQTQAKVVGGTPPPLTPQDAGAAVTQAQAEAANPALAQHMQEQQQKAK